MSIVVIPHTFTEVSVFVAGGCLASIVACLEISLATLPSRVQIDVYPCRSQSIGIPRMLEDITGLWLSMAEYNKANTKRNTTPINQQPTSQPTNKPINKPANQPSISPDAVALERRDAVAKD